MKQYIYVVLLALLTISPATLSAQQIFSAEIAPYEMREEAEQRSRKLKEYFQDITPKQIYSTDSTALVRQIFMLPAKWSDRTIVLHVEDVASAYDLIVNDINVLSNEDEATPTNVDITKYMSQGVNRIDFLLRDTKLTNLRSSLFADSKRTESQQTSFNGSYLVAFPHTYIQNFDIDFWASDASELATLDIAIALRNSFTNEESIDVGFDIYDPSGKLLDYSVNTFTVPGGVTDTIRFSPKISAPLSNRWSAESPQMYKVMLYTRRNGVITEYIPRNVGLLNIEYKNERLYNFNTPLSLNIETYSPQGAKEQSRTELRAFKAKGRNTIALTHPQPLWFYELCYEEGLWVIDRININSTIDPSNKKVGGTPANDPSLVDEYLRRGKAAYHRSCEFKSVIAYSLGGDDAGNGYNMYKLYEWIKSVEPNRPIIYNGVRGEWNSDTLK